MAEQLDLTNYIDGIVISKQPGETKECVTFTTTIPFQEVAFDSGFTLRFAGPLFTHDHPRVVQILRGLAARGTGIFEVKTAEAAEKTEKTDSVLKDGAKIDTTVKS